MLTAQTTLLQNPLVLALESLRGIAIRIVAVINLAEAALCLIYALRQFFPLSTSEHILPPTGAVPFDRCSSRAWGYRRDEHCYLRVFSR